MLLILKILSNEYLRGVYDQFGEDGIEFLNSHKLVERKLTLDQVITIS
jgi:hypothetical protein